MFPPFPALPGPAQILQFYQQIVVLTAQHDFVFSTGAGVSYQQPIVIMMWQTNVMAANALLALILVWIGYNVMLGYYEPLYMLSRVVLAAVASNASLQLIGLFVQVNDLLIGQTLQTLQLPQIIDLAAFLGRPPGGVLDGGAAIVLQFLIIMLGALGLIFQMVVRLALLDLLIVVSPLAMLLYITPATQRWAQLWSAAFSSVLFVQFLQITALVLGARLITTISASSDIVSFFGGVALLILVLRIPRMLQNAVTGMIGETRSTYGVAGQVLTTIRGGLFRMLRSIP